MLFKSIVNNPAKFSLSRKLSHTNSVRFKHKLKLLNDLQPKASQSV